MSILSWTVVILLGPVMSNLLSLLKTVKTCFCVGYLYRLKEHHPETQNIILLWAHTYSIWTHANSG